MATAIPATPQVATAAIRALISGPNPAQVEAGLSSDGPVSRLDYLAALPMSPTVLDSVERLEQADLPEVSRLGPDVRRVVLVAEDDVLNVRLAAGVDNEIIGMLAPGTMIRLTGPQRDVGQSTFAEIVTPAGAGWVNSRFLAEIIDDADFASDGRVLDLLDRFSAVFDAEGDLNEFMSQPAAPIRFTPAQLEGILTDMTTYKWPSNALDMDDPSQVAEIPDRTFAEAIAWSFVSTWDDPDRIVALDEALSGGNGRPPEFAIWPELQGIHFVSVLDPGDSPEFDGLDWTLWHVSIYHEDNEPVVVGMTYDEWSP